MRSRSTDTAFMRLSRPSPSSKGMATVRMVAAAAMATSRENMNCGSFTRSANSANIWPPHISKLIIFFMDMTPTNIQNPQIAITVRPPLVIHSSEMYLGLDR